MKNITKFNRLPQDLQARLCAHGDGSEIQVSELYHVSLCANGNDVVMRCTRPETYPTVADLKADYARTEKLFTASK